MTNNKYGTWVERMGQYHFYVLHEHKTLCKTVMLGINYEGTIRESHLKPCPECENKRDELGRIPLTGVINLSSVPHIYDEMDSHDTINVTYEAYLEEHLLECPDHDICSGSDYESDCGDTLLIGDWRRDDEGTGYEPLYTGNKGFSAVVREATAQVVWSQTTVRIKSLCSPCYPMQGDLDSGTIKDGGILCYTFPPDMFDTEEN